MRKSFTSVSREFSRIEHDDAPVISWISGFSYSSLSRTFALNMLVLNRWQTHAGGKISGSVRISIREIHSAASFVVSSI